MIEEQESIPLLRLFEDILYNRIKQKKQEMHRTHNRSDTDRVFLDRGTNTSVDFRRVLISERGSRSDTITNKW